MRRFWFLLFVMLSCMMLPSFCAELPETIQIGLKYGNAAQASVEISSTVGFRVVKPSGEELVLEGSTLLIEKLESGFILNGELDFSDVASVTVYPGAEGDFLSVFGKRYRGALRIDRLPQSDLTLVNVVKFEEYLYSVVGKEMSPSWPKEALKAQAICARTFAAANMQKYQKYGFNLDDTTACQVYGGYDAEDPRVIAAVDETAGQIITYQGQIAGVTYFSTSGGYTEDSENVWTTAVPYLRAVEDIYESKTEPSKAYWTVEVTPEEVQAVLLQRGVDIGTVVDIRAEEVLPTGRVKTLRLVGTKGEKVYEKDAVRSAIGAGKLFSAMFTVRKSGGDTGIQITKGGSSSGVQLKNAELFAQRYNATLQYTGAGPQQFVFEGRGYGHGVGMSQYGAKGMAEQGFSCQEIIKFYFTGVEVG